MNEIWLTGVASHQGAIKEKNEDSFLHLMAPDGNGAEIALFVVADGMGGYDGGEVASRHAIDGINYWWNKRIHKIVRRKDPLQRIIKEGEKLFRQINSSLQGLAKKMGKKMGTTLSLLVMYKGSYAVLHIGDSRIYQLRNWMASDSPSHIFRHYLTEHHDEQKTFILPSDPELLKLTEDHSWVAQQVEKGLLDEERARIHPKRHVLTQCLGIGAEVTPYIHEGKYAADDLFLVCSDGFYSLYSDDEIKNMLLNLEKEYGDLQAVSDYLVNFSNFAEAGDNVTLMLVRHDYRHHNETQLDDYRIFSFFKGRSS